MLKKYCSFLLFLLALAPLIAQNTTNKLNYIRAGYKLLNKQKLTSGRYSIATSRPCASPTLRVQECYYPSTPYRNPNYRPLFWNPIDTRNGFVK